MKITLFSQEDLRIALAGGGTGGHIFPLLGIIRAFKREMEGKLNCKFYFFGSGDFPLNEIEKEGIKVIEITAGKVNRFFDLKNFLSPFKLIIGFFQALFFLYIYMPDVLISKGGYGSIPLVLAAYLYRIPIYVHESDSVIGLANQISMKFAKKIFFSFPHTKGIDPTLLKKGKAILVGNPSLFEERDKKVDEDQAYSFFGFSKNRKTILILGGSQGSEAINEFSLNIIDDLISNEVQIIHQTGEKNFLEVKHEAEVVLETFLEEEKRLYFPIGFLDKKSYALAFKIADLVIARAGSGTIFDIAFFCKPAILVPFPYASRNHQMENAYQYAKTGAAIVVEQENLLEHLALNTILELLKDENKLKEMGQAACSFSTPEAADKIAREIVSSFLG